MSYTNKVKMLQSVAMILVVLLVSATALVLASRWVSSISLASLQHGL
jgi:hypothetical protein